MRFYRIRYVGECGPEQHWETDKHMAEWHVRQAAKEMEMKLSDLTHEIDAVEIPTTRKALKAWLNENFKGND